MTSPASSPFDAAATDRERPWTRQDMGINAIAGLLNETNSTFTLKGLDTMLSLPMGGGGGVPGGGGASSASSLSSAIRRVKLSDFDPYLGTLGEAYDKYQLHRAMGLGAATEGIPELSRKKNKHLQSKDGEVADAKVSSAAPIPADEDLSASFSSLEEWTARLAMAGSHVSAQLPPLRSTGLPPASSVTSMNSNSTTATTKGPVAPLTLSKTRMYSGNAPPVSSLPALYFEPSFSLGNPHTFAAVCEYADVTGISSSESFTTQRLLQEKLSHYLDVVEVHLIKEISTRAPSFFGALANLQALHQETQACVDRITELRDHLKKLSDTSIKKGLQIARLKRMRGNLDLFYGTVRLASEMKQTQPMIQVLLNEGDYVGALELIDHAGRYLKGQALYSGGNTTNGSPMGGFGADGTDVPAIRDLGPGVELHTTQSVISSKIELKNVKCLGTLSTQLVEVSRTIFSVMEADLVSILMKDLTEIVSTPIGIPSTKEKQRGFVSERLRGSPVDSWIKKILNHSSASANATAGSPTALEHAAAEVSPPTESMLVKEEALKTRLLPVILGLLRINRLEDALSTFKERLLTEIKAWSKKHYPSNFYVPEDPNAGATQKDRQSALAKQLRNMSFDKFFDLLLMVYITILHVLQRLSINHALISQIIQDAHARGMIVGMEALAGSTIHPEPNPRRGSDQKQSPLGTRTRRKTLDDDDDLDVGVLDAQSLETNEWSKNNAIVSTTVGHGSVFESLMMESANVLASACDLAHVRCAKLIGVRSDQNAMLNPIDFYRLFGATWDFVNGAESITGRVCFGLKGTMVSQAKSFISYFHEERSKQLTLMIENEQWTQAEVPIDFQLMVDSFARSKHGELNQEEEEDSRMKYWKEKEEDSDTASIMSSTRRPRAGMESKSSQLIKVGGEQFFVVGVVLLFVKIVTDYIQCAQFVPALVTDVLNRILELLKLFNSRSCQMILGAGALKSAGLKNITARHIALTAQSLSVIIAMIPHIKDTFQQLLPARQQILLSDFDRLLKDCKDHRSELFQKLVSIMQERLEGHIQKLHAVLWDNPDPKDLLSDGSVTLHMASVVKETSNLYKVTVRYLPLDTIKLIMNSILKQYNVKLEEELKKMDFFTSSGKSRLLTDIQFLIERLSMLDDIDGPGSHLEVVVNNIKIKDKRHVSASPSPSSVSPSKPGLVSGSSVSSLTPGLSKDLSSATQNASKRASAFFGKIMRPSVSPAPSLGGNSGNSTSTGSGAMPNLVTQPTSAPSQGLISPKPVKASGYPLVGSEPPAIHHPLDDEED